MIFHKPFLIYLSLSFLIHNSLAQTTAEMTYNPIEVIPLNEGWKFSEAEEDAWMDAAVPGCVHTDLISNDKIEDPFYRLNEHDVQWIDKKDWIYQTTFQINENTLAKQNINLVFDGLDTYADVYLNGIKILEADNMFRTWEVNVKSHLKEGENSLRIYFHSPIKIGLDIFDNYPHEVHSSGNDLSEIGQVPGNKKVSPFLRKAQYHFGWDWGPRLVTSGIWLPVHLKAWNAARIISVRSVQKELHANSAKMDMVFEIESNRGITAELSIQIDQKTVKRKEVQLVEGNHTYTVSYDIKNPRRWWPNGLGEAHLYEVSAIMKAAGNADGKSHKVGLRTIEVVREKDDRGTSMYFVVNGQPVFMKGANYIPCDVFLDRVTPEKYEEVILTAKASHFNMLRVWGGGIYEKDIFYDLCDEHGIMVWQDFMFACNMYPGHPEYLESVRHEAVTQVKRLRNHPSLAIWCGNNEILAAWFQWGWQREVEQKDPAGAAAQWKAYKDIFLDILPNTINEWDEGRFYWASSPQSGDSIPSDLINGDDHYWGVWWGKEPFSNYQTHLSRFMSEYGFQSFPELKTVETYATQSDYDIYSEVMKSHQRSSIGNETIETYLLRDYRKPKDFTSFLYVGQVLQAEGIKHAMESHRIAMPFTMGSLYWQINDVWPVASWSSTDYYVRWKAVQYFSEKAFRDIIIAPRLEDDLLKIYVVSDRLQATNAKIELRLLDFKGNELWRHSEDIEIWPNASSAFFEMDKRAFIKEMDPQKLILHTAIKENDEVVSENNYYFLPVKDLHLPKPTITMATEVSPDGKEANIVLSSDVLAKNVFLSLKDGDGFFLDNYFDLLPGEKKMVSCKLKSINKNQVSFSLRSLRDTYE
jgi:beta-mannosidase